MASTFSATTTAQAQPWVVIIRISGIGASDTQYSFCTDVPAYASATYYLPYLPDLPRIQGEALPPLGGIVNPGSLDFQIVDYSSTLSALIKLNTLPFSALTADNTTTNDATAVVYSVPDATLFTVGSYYFMGGECIKVTAKSGTSLTVDREKRGTMQEPHFIGETIYTHIAFLSSRKVQCYLVPRDASSASEEQLIGTYFISGVKISPTNVWSFDCSNELFACQRTIGDDSAGYFISLGLRNNQPFIVGVNSFPVRGELDKGVYLQTTNGYYVSDGEEVGFVSSDGETFRSNVGFLNAKEVTNPDELNRVFVALPDQASTHYKGSFRVSYGQALIGANPSTTVFAYGSANPVDVLLNFMTSPYSQYDGISISTNYDNAYGNWAILPAGYGLGIKISDIDMPSFLAVRQRIAEFPITGFRIGTEGESFDSLVTQGWMQALGIYLMRDFTTGKYTLRMLRMPNAAESLTAITTDHIMEDALPDVGIIDALGNVRMIGRGVTLDVNSVTPTGRQTALLGDQPVEGYTIDGAAYGMSTGGTFALAHCAVRHLAYGLSARVSVSLRVTMDLWGILPGDAVSLTLPGITNPLTGAVFNTDPMLVASCTPQLEPYVHLALTLVSFSASKPPIIGASGEVSTSSITGGNTTLTLLPYTFCTRYSVDDHVAADVNGFSVGDVVDLVDETDGTTATSSNYGTITAINTGANTITVSGTFGGMTTGAMNVCVVVPAPYASASTAQKNQIAYIGDAGDNTINGTGTAWRLGGV